MLGLFKKKTKIEKMQEQYEKLMSESHTLSTSNRTASDKKYAEAQDLLKEMEVLEALNSKK